MIAFGSVTTQDSEFQAAAAAGIEAVSEPDSLLLRRHGFYGQARLANEMLDIAAARSDVEAFVLLAEDATVAERGFAGMLRDLLERHPRTALIGPAGIGARGVAAVARSHVVVFAPWAIRELRFDETVDMPIECGVAEIWQRAAAVGRPVVEVRLPVFRRTLWRRAGARSLLVAGAASLAGKSQPSMWVRQRS